MNNTYFMVMTGRAKMPSSCDYARYYAKVAVYECRCDMEPPRQMRFDMKQIVSMPFFRDRLFRGVVGGSSAFERALKEARALCHKLNAENGCEPPCGVDAGTAPSSDD